MSGIDPTDEMTKCQKCQNDERGYVQLMKPRYTEPMNIKEARSWLKHNFGSDTRISWGSRCYWVAGVQYVTDQPGVYLVGAAGGMCGVQVIAPVAENMAVAS